MTAEGSRQAVPRGDHDQADDGQRMLARQNSAGDCEALHAKKRKRPSLITIRETHTVDTSDVDAKRGAYRLVVSNGSALSNGGGAAINAHVVAVAATKKLKTPRRWHMSASQMFLLQAALTWFLLCVPGNAVTLILFLKVSGNGNAGETEAVANATDAPQPSLATENTPEAKDESFLQYARLLDCVCAESRVNTSVNTCVVAVECNATSQVYIGSQDAKCRERSYQELSSSCPHVLVQDGPTPEDAVDPDNTLECYELQSEYDDFLSSVKFWVEGVCVCVVGAFGLCGNALTIIVLSMRRFDGPGASATGGSSNFNKLLVSLAVVDNLLIMYTVVDTAIIHTFMPAMPLWYKLSYPYFLHPAKGMVQTTAIFMVVAVAVERYKAVCYPLSFRQAPFKYILMVILVSVGLETPRFFQFRLVRNNTDFWTTELMEDPTYIQFSSYWDEMITTGGVPLIVLAYCNLRMILKIRTSNSRFSHRFVGRQESSLGGPGQCVTAQTTIAAAGAGTVVRASPPRRCASVLNRGKDVDVELRRHRKTEEACAPVEVVVVMSASRKCSPDAMAVEAESSSPNITRQSTRGRLLQPTMSMSTRHYSTAGVATANNKDSTHFNRRRDKSTVILVMIVVIFIACHSYRLALKVYEFANPESNTMEHFTVCHGRGRYHIPLVFYVLVNIHHLFLVVNSSTNFVIYCCVGQEFRSKVARLLCRR